MNSHELILILDFGSQYTQLIARRVREARVYCEILPYNADLASYQDRKVIGCILSGGPSSVLDSDAPSLDRSFLNIGVPILGICYGMQLMVNMLGGRLTPAKNREYGRERLEIGEGGRLLAGVAQNCQVWMSHGDSVEELPDGFRKIGMSAAGKGMAVIENEQRGLYGLQFHPEVHHTDEGSRIIRNFLFDICGARGDWTTESFIEETIGNLNRQIGDSRVVLGISGGVDSSVAAMLLSKAVDDRLYAIFVDNGLLRKNEAIDVTEMLGGLGINLRMVDAADLFLERLTGVEDPERKRKIIGTTFIDVFEQEAERIGGVQYLAQGTLYPDVIESVSFKGPSATIKSHHNVGGLKDRMSLKLVEPLRELFKDEVRALGRALGLPEQFVGRHPFPGPGLAVRILGEITRERLDLLREVDFIFIEELHRHNIYDEIWQAFSVLLPVRAVGVMGDQRTYENVVALRAVTSVDGMTADWARIDPDILAHISNRIIRQVSGVNRVTYDISSKPPATIEWE